MKPILITLLSVALASSCANHEVKRLLTEAESLMQDHPDSALSIIESIDTAALMTKAQRADFSLLHAMALDKNYIDTTDLRVIAPAFRYFRNHGSDQDKMRTLYYQGRIYINADDYSNAVISLNNALEYAQGEEYLDKGRIYSALSVSYCNSHNNIEELTCSRHAYDNFLKSGSEKYLDSARYLLALSLRNNNLVDEADSVFNSIYSGKDSTARLSRTVMCAQASNCLQMDFPDYVKACKLFGYLEKNGAAFSENDILEYAFSLLNCGERAESDRLLSTLDERIVSGKSHFFLYKILKAKGMTDTALHHLEEYLDYQNDYVKSKLEQSVFKAQSENYSLISEKSKQEVKSARIGNLALVLTMIALLLLAYLIYKDMERSFEQERERQNNAVEESRVLLRELTDKYEADKVQNKDKIRELRKVYMSLYQKQLKEIGKLYDAHTAHKKDAIIEIASKKSKETIAKILAELSGSSSGQRKFEQRINQDVDNVISKIRSDFPKFDDDDIRFISYLIAGFDSATISFLMDMKKDTVRVRRYRIKHMIAEYCGPNADMYKIVFE